MLIDDISPGQYVKFREWDDMATEFDVDMDGDIALVNDGYFTNHMKKLCGLVVCVNSIDEEEDEVFLTYEDTIMCESLCGFSDIRFLANMFEPVLDDQLEICETDLMDILGVQK